MVDDRQRCTSPGDTAEWQNLLAQCRGSLFMLARQYLHHPQEAEDALQEGVIRFWRSRPRVHDGRAFLYACVRSAAIDARRANLTRRRHEHWAGMDAAREAIATPLLAAPAERDERRRQIEEALRSLSEEQREVLVMKIWGDLTFAQIAAALHISQNTAASRYRYGLEHLQKVLSREVVCE